jgi:hypothetical protein
MSILKEAANNLIAQIFHLRLYAVCSVPLIAIPCLVHSQQTGPQPVVVNLPRNVTVTLQSNWVRFTDDSRSSLDRAVIDSLGRHGLSYTTSDLSFAANLYDGAGTVVAMFNIRYYPDQTFTQAEVKGLSNIDIGEVDKALRSEIEEVASTLKRPILTWGGTARSYVNEYCTLLTEYQRPSPNGAFRVRLLRVLDGPNSFTITVSTRTDAGESVKATMDDIIHSLRKR